MKRALAIDERVSTWALWLACALALAILPRPLFPPAWCAAFLLPAVLLHVLLERHAMSLTRAVPLAGAFHVGTILGAHALSGGIESETALGCSLLPPLAFLAARRRGDDFVWALFLALCAVLISTILGAPPAWMLWSFLAASYAALQLHTIARAAVRQRAWRGAFGPRRLAVGGLSACMVATLGVSFGTLQVLSHLPKPGERRSEPQETDRAARKSVGLSDRFEFGSSGDGFLDLRTDELVRARPLEGEFEPELYLRTAQFEIPGLVRWSKARPNDRGVVPETAVQHRGELTPEAPTHALDILAHEKSDQFLFLPPGTYELRGLGRVIGNPSQETYLREARGTARYQVRYQNRSLLARQQEFDPSFEGLRGLPREFDDHLAPFQRILRDAGGTRVQPAVLADRIARVLQRRHLYLLREPRGPYGDGSILNFVDGEGVGFCMHFASTLAICLRLAEIPCRIAVGLYAGTAELAGAGEVVLGSQHAHAWVEVPLAGIGWVVFDPTPPSHAGHGAAQVALADEAAGGSTSIAAWLDSWAVWILIACAGLGVWLAAGRRDRGLSPAEAARRALDPDLASLFRTLVRALHRLVPRARGQSLQDWVASLARDGRVPIEAVSGAFTAYEEIRFGRRELDAERSQRIRAAVRAARAAAKAQPIT